MKQKNFKLKNFDNLYNKFIFQWSQGKDLSNIIDDLNDIKNNIQNDLDQQYNNQNIQNIQNNQQECNINKQSCENDEYIKDEFFKLFPAFLLHKCQIKFPIDDNIQIPTDIIQDFWNKYKEQIISSLINVSKDIIVNSLMQLFISLFGKQDEYNEDIFNPYAMRLVSMME